MKPQRAFIAERAAAQHCAELLRGPSVKPVEVRPALDRMAARLARALPAALAPLLGQPPRVSAAPARDSDAGMLAATVPPLAANSLLNVRGAPLLATIDAAAVLRMVDKAYGGRGEVPEPLPDAFPLSAQLMIGRIEALVIAQLAEALECSTDEVACTRRDGSLVQLAPFADATPLIIADLLVEEDGRNAWTLSLAVPQVTLSALFGAEERANPAQTPRGAASPWHEPFADMTLELTATVVDMQMPFPAVAQLRLGQLLPVAVARAVPLSIGGKIVAHGTIGALDDRVAVQITKAF